MVDLETLQMLKIAKAIYKRQEGYTKTILISELLRKDGGVLKLRYAYTGDFVISNDTEWEKYVKGHTPETSGFNIIKQLPGEDGQTIHSKVLRVWLNYFGEYIGEGVNIA